jgi:osmoprotectant transport system ATP-binding protein
VIEIENASKRYGGHAALLPTSLTVSAGKTTVLIGPSGCGKSTLLRLIVGLIQPDDGRISVDGVAVGPATIDGLRHRIGYVIQDGGLFPHLTAARNASLLADYLGKPREQTRARVKELADLVQLPEDILSRFPAELSGGQRQRVSLMRALMLDPIVLLLDEPFGALDPITRRELQRELKGIIGRLRKTVVMVTHDMGEAAYFGDEIVLMRAGRIVQAASLQDLIDRPADPYVTEFIQAQRSPLDDIAVEVKA